MQTIELVAGSTFAFAGPVANLDGTIAWGVAASVRVKGAASDLDQFTASIEQAVDFATTGNWLVRIGATAAQTAAWWTSSQLKMGELVFDLKLFNTAAPDPVLRSEPIRLKLTQAVTA